MCWAGLVLFERASGLYNTVFGALGILTDGRAYKSHLRVLYFRDLYQQMILLVVTLEGSSWPIGVEKESLYFSYETRMSNGL